MSSRKASKKSILFNLQWIASTAAVFAITALALSGLGFMPEAEKIEAKVEPEVAAVTLSGDPTPVRVIIDQIGVDSPIVLPKSTDITVMDTALLGGVAQYPGSADLDDVGNMFLFGHSSGRPVIYNPSFKVFNKVGSLVTGDLIKVQSKTDENVYRVTKVQFADKSEIDVPLQTGKRMLTISTCNSFGDKSARIVVTAEYLYTHPIGSTSGTVSNNY